MNTFTPSLRKRSAELWSLMPARKLAHTRHRVGKCDLRLAGKLYAESRSIARILCRSCRADHSFRRDTTDVQTIAAQKVALDQSDLGTEPRGSGRADQTGSARANNN